MVYILLIVLVVVIIRMASLISKVEMLERDVRKLGEMVVNGVSTPAPTLAQQPQVAHTPVPPQMQQYIPEPEKPNAFAEWLKENWLLKLGVLMILIAFGWFISYAFIHNWIGPVGRVTLGFIVGSILAIFGTARIPVRPTQGKTFLVLGSALVVITSYASQVVYGFFSPAVAIFIPFVVAMFVATVGATYMMKSVGIYAVFIGFLAPLLTHADKLDPNLLFIYLAVTSMASVWLAVRKNWRIINALSVAGIFLYSIEYVFDGTNYFLMTILLALSVVYFAVSILSIVRSKIDASPSDVFVAIFNSILIMMVVMGQIPEEMQSLMLAAWMIVFAFGGLFVFTKTGKQTFFYIYSLIAVVFLATATAIEFEGPALIFAYAIESAVITLASYLVTKRYDIGLRMSALMAGPALMALPSFDYYGWRGVVLNDDFFIILVIGLLLLLVGGFYYLIREQEVGERTHAYAAHIIVGSAFLLGLLWIALKVGMGSRSQAVMISLAVYSILGIICYFSGLFRGNKITKYYGGTLLILVVLRLVFVDVWDMPLASRITTFLLIGAIFISTAFIAKKKEVKV